LEISINKDIFAVDVILRRRNWKDLKISKLRGCGKNTVQKNPRIWRKSNF